MSTTTIGISKNTWTEVLTAPGRWQVRGNKTIFYVESSSQPSGLDNYFIAEPGKVHNFSQLGVSLWIYTKSSNITIAKDSPSSSDVFIQDQTTRPFDFYFLKALGALTTVAIDLVANTRTITVADATGFATGQDIGVSGDPTNTKFYFARIVGVSGNIITVDTPIDYPFLTGASVFNATRNFAVNGSVTPQVFSIFGPGAGSGLEIDITRLLMKCFTNGAVDLSKFGDIAGGLTLGLVLRKNNPEYENIFNVKNNGELANLAYDWTPYSSTNPQQGQDGFLWRYTFAGQDKHGVTIRLEAGESLELVVQDDLSSIDTLNCIAAGHIVE